MKQEEMGARIAQTFKYWGISTIDSLNNGVDSGITTPLWASGGVRDGLQAAKLIALGAHKVGFAKPILEKALEGTKALLDRMEQLDNELKVALFCLGLDQVESLIGKRMLLRWI
jgi:isopentenyl-diphosphate delta-isomerase